MERLTFEGNFCDIAMCRETPGGSFCEDGSCSQRRVWEKLKKYEDAEQDGRLLEMPCKVGDTIWRIKRFADWPDIGKPYVEADAFLYRDIHYFGKTVFLTREEAEAALAGKGGTE